MGATKARLRANSRYRIKNYETISYRQQKTERTNDRIKAAAALHGEKPAQYLARVVNEAIAADGVRVEDLPPE